MTKTHSLINYMTLARDILTRSPKANAINMTRSNGEWTMDDGGIRTFESIVREANKVNGTRSSLGDLNPTDGFEALAHHCRVHATRSIDSLAHSHESKDKYAQVPLEGYESNTRSSSFDFDYINTMWESDDWELKTLTRSSPATNPNSDSFTRSSPIPTIRSSLAHQPSHSLISYKRHGGIHFIRLGQWSISASRKRKTRRVEDVEERLLRLLAPLVIWPALCITVILLCEAIGYSGR
jgi:hypothetical protein